MRVQSVQQLALAVRQRADLGGQQNAFGANGSEAITDTEMLTLLNASVGVVWDVLTEHYPENYSWGWDGNPTGIGYMFPIIQGTYQYNLPYDFYKEKGVDLSLDASLQNWATMRPYSIRDRNLFSYPLQTVLAYAGWQNMRWMIQGNKINFLPKQGPLPDDVRLLYAPAAPLLVPALPVVYQANAVTAQNAYVKVNLATETGELVEQVFYSLNAGTTGASAIGTTTAAVSYISKVGNSLVSIHHTTGGTAGVSVTKNDIGSTIFVQTGSDTADQVASLVNSDPVAGPLVTAAGGGSGTAVGGAVTCVEWLIPGVGSDNGIQWAYQGPLSLFATSFDGISGYEDLIILDASIKAGIKIEQDVSAMMAQRAEWMDRIIAAASNRNSGDPMTVSGGFGMAEGGPAMGGGFGPWAGGGDG